MTLPNSVLTDNASGEQPCGPAATRGRELRSFLSAAGWAGCRSQVSMWNRLSRLRQGDKENPVETLSKAERLGYLVAKPLISIAWALYRDLVTFYLL